MPGVLLVEDRDAAAGALERVVVAHVPVGDQGVPVGVGVDRQEDDLVQDAHRLGVVAADHLPGEFHELLDGQNLGRVQPPVDPHHGLALGGERAGVLLGETLGPRQPPCDLPVAGEVGHVGGRGDRRHPLFAPLRRPADRLEGHAVGLPGENVPVLGELLVVDELVVGADPEAELLLGGSELGGGGGGGQGGQGEEGGEAGWRMGGGARVHGVFSALGRATDGGWGG